MEFRPLSPETRLRHFRPTPDERESPSRRRHTDHSPSSYASASLAEFDSPAPGGTSPQFARRHGLTDPGLLVGRAYSSDARSPSRAARSPLPAFHTPELSTFPSHTPSPRRGSPVPSRYDSQSYDSPRYDYPSLASSGEGRNAPGSPVGSAAAAAPRTVAEWIRSLRLPDPHSAIRKFYLAQITLETVPSLTSDDLLQLDLDASVRRVLLSGIHRLRAGQQGNPSSPKFSPGVPRSTSPLRVRHTPSPAPRSPSPSRLGGTLALGAREPPTFTPARYTGSTQSSQYANLEALAKEDDVDVALKHLHSINSGAPEGEIVVEPEEEREDGVMMASGDQEPEPAAGAPLPAAPAAASAPAVPPAGTECEEERARFQQEPDYFLVSWEDLAEMPQRDFYPFTSKAKSHINYLELFAVWQQMGTGGCFLVPVWEGDEAYELVSGMREVFRPGVRRKWDRPAKPVMPITLRDLARMAEFADMESITGLALWAAILVGFYGLFRKDNLTTGKSQAWNARAMRLNVERLYIKLQGDWKSDCWERYCELDDEQRLILPAAFAEAAKELS
ncbi:hypothetical protein CYMTET_15262 [Cymbomonas tetramitiformis]|uniref:Uncharacterized protein n=1 Tax=Cymbomonas tetramitiformis TaxID=36881 RepID=A0AAE0GEL2_9CHLO|nr:hypothetical protein CYMTET_15262 [Cymbomonas tetramitiformis]